MADLADKIDDLICSFEGGGDTTMDTVAMLLFGWIIFGLFVYGIGKFIYTKYVKSAASKTNAVAAAAAATTSVSEETITKRSVGKETRNAGGYIPPTPPVRKRIGSKKGAPSGPLKTAPKLTPANLPPPATGPDSESVHWVNQVFAWLYSDPVALNELLGVWVQSLNESTKKSVTEVSLFPRSVVLCCSVESVRLLSTVVMPSEHCIYKNVGKDLWL